MKPTRAYLDLNIFDHATDAWEDGQTFMTAAGSAGYKLCLGTEVLHELIMRCKDPDKADRTQAIATFILGAWDGLVLVPALQTQMREEASQAREEPEYREAVALHRLEEEHLHQTKSKEVLLRIQDGRFAEALEEVQEREEGSEDEWRKAAEEAKRQAEAFLAEHPDKREEASTPEGFRRLANVGRHLSQWLPKEDMTVIEKIVLGPKVFPVLNALVNVDVRIAWVNAFGTLGERGSRLQDYGHLISASGMDLIVTDDAWLQERFGELSPVERCMSREGFDAALKTP